MLYIYFFSLYKCVVMLFERILSLYECKVVMQLYSNVIYIFFHFFFSVMNFVMSVYEVALNLL